jgi:restriction endonuclease Mrr
MDPVREQNDPSASFFNLVYVCDKCGWWNTEAADSMQVDSETAVIREALIVGTLRRFNIADSSIPVDLLWAEIAKHPHAATASSPAAFERLVGDVLRSVRACEVKHVGRTADGGIDLLLVTNETVTAVQVKRRTSLDRSEGVELVREFLGAMLLADLRNGVLVTTGRRYTTPARKAAAQAEALALADRFELLDFPSFLSMMRSDVPAPWHVYRDTEHWLHSKVGY